MTFPQLARQYGGVAYREEDRGDDGLGGSGGGGGGDDADATAKAEAEAKAAKEADERRAQEKADREKNITIPKARHDEAVGREREARRAAEKRAQEAEAREAARNGGKEVEAVQKEIDDLYDELDKASADNNAAEKRRIRAAIRDREQAIADFRAEQKSEHARALAVEQVTYNGVVDRAEADYPFLRAPTDDEPNEDFKPELLEPVMALKAGYEAGGLSSSKALSKALRTLKTQLDAAKKAEKNEDPEAAAKAEAEAKAKAEAAAKEAEGKGGKRKEEAVERGKQAQAQQPAPKPGVAGTADKNVKEIKVKDLSDSDFDKLPEAEKKRLRGD